MSAIDPIFRVKLATTEAEIRAAQRLRYDVFVTELGGDGAQVDHVARLEQDRFDAWVDHLLLIDEARGGLVAGAYRLLPSDRVVRTGGFYSQSEYDLGLLLTSGRRLLELGRSCVRTEYRGGLAMMHLWNGLAEYVRDHDIDILFGVASFKGTEPASLAAPLSLLHHRHLAPADLRVRSTRFEAMDMIPEADLDRVAALREVPPLIKAYLKLGGFVGEGAFVDRDFNTTDVCLVLDTARMNPRQRALYSRGGVL